MKTIKLKNSKELAIIDEEDFERLNSYTWFSTPKGYALRNYKYYKGTILMHREILNLRRGDKKVAHHKNRNTLDNRKENLEIVTQSENQQNAIKRIDFTSCSSKYKGVSWCKGEDKWKSYIMLNDKLIHLGLFKTEIDAARAYNEAALKYFTHFRLNEINEA